MLISYMKQVNKKEKLSDKDFFKICQQKDENPFDQLRRILDNKLGGQNFHALLKAPIKFFSYLAEID